MNWKKIGIPFIWLYAFGYFLAYVPYSALTKAVTNGILNGQKMLGAEILPLSTLSSFVGLYLFISIAGWWKYANHRKIGRFSIPCPTRWTFLSGVCTGLIVVTTTMAYTIEGVSIVFAMLLLRGGVLVISPVVDRLTGRRVRWFSWSGLVLSLLALIVAFVEPVKPGTSRFAFNAMLCVDVLIYLASYFFRLQFMSKLAKSDDRNKMKGYFVEEQMTGLPVVIVILALFAIIGPAVSSNEHLLALADGFTQIWFNPLWSYVVLVGLFSLFTGVFGTLILLDNSETTFAVPVNRSSSVLAGVAASLALWYFADLKCPSVYEFTGAGCIIVAILFLSISPALMKKHQTE